jgi:hypothetical protein
MAVMLETWSVLMLLSIWLTTASTSCEAVVLLEARDCNVSHRGKRVLACAEFIARLVFSSLNVPTSRSPSRDSVVEVDLAALALGVLPQAASTANRLIMIGMNIHFFILISYQDVRAFYPDEIPTALILLRITNGCLDFV